MLNKILLAAIALGFWATSPAFAGSKKAQCFLQVSGSIYINGVGGFDAFDKDGSFSVTKSDHGNGWFAYVYPKGDGTATAFWNNGGDHAHTNLPTLHKHGACWVNGNTKVCAGKVGEKMEAQ